jgi:hypothetical protein
MLSFPGPGLYLADIPLPVIFTASDAFNVHRDEIFNRFSGYRGCVIHLVTPVMLYLYVIDYKWYF